MNSIFPDVSKGSSHYLRVLRPREPPLYGVLELVGVQVVLRVLGLAHGAEGRLPLAASVELQGFQLGRTLALRHRYLAH